MNHRSLILLGAALAFAGARPAAGEEAAPARAQKSARPAPGASADELMRNDYLIKYTKFAEDLRIDDSRIYYISKSGDQRVRQAKRLRITLNRAADGLDYKDLIVITAPENVKGLGVLTWSYLDPARQRDQWLWLPSLKKVRRSSPAEAEDAFMGSDFTTEDLTSRRFEDETYAKLPDEVFPGYTLRLNGAVINKDVPCLVVECTPKRKDWYYGKRKVYLDAATGANIFEEIYDPKGRKVRTIARLYEPAPEGPFQKTIEAADLATGHATANVNDAWAFNTGLSEQLFTEKSLMRSDW